MMLLITHSFAEKDKNIKQMINWEVFLIRGLMSPEYPILSHGEFVRILRGG